ncbi:MAG: hypothetical protein ACHQUA_00040 [Microgenomates group bacterium]
MRNHIVIIVSGLGDYVQSIKLATYHWKIYGLTPIVHSANWKNNKEPFEIKFKKLLDLVDSFLEKGKPVSLIGTSAGASLALNAFLLRKNGVNKFVNICGRLKVGPIVGPRSFIKMTKTSLAFADSVKKAEFGIKSLTKNDLKRIMTVRSMFGDQFVPPETSIVEGAKNITVPIVEHTLSIGISLMFYSAKIASFLTKTTT